MPPTWRPHGARSPRGSATLARHPEGVILEGPTFSVAWVVGGVLETPGLDLGILDSITRRVMLEMASELGLEVVQGTWDLGASTTPKRRWPYPRSARSNQYPRSVGVDSTKGRSPPTWPVSTINAPTESVAGRARITALDPRRQEEHGLCPGQDAVVVESRVACATGADLPELGFGLVDGGQRDLGTPSVCPPAATSPPASIRIQMARRAISVSGRP